MMKKLIAISLLLVLTLGIVGCAINNAEIPALEDIKTNYYTDDELERMLHRVKRDELIEAWGESTRHMDYENEDVWVLDERKALVISYTISGRVDDADIED